MSKQSPSPSEQRSERRSFLTRFNAGTAALAALAVGSVARAQVKPASVARWEPARHDKDDWMDGLPGKHRLVFDTITQDGFKDALLFAGNYMIVNRTEYGLENKDLAVIIVVRHLSTGFGYNNAMWAKYGASLGDTQAKEPPKANPSAAALESLANQGVQFAVCAMATRRLAGTVARAVGGNADAIYAELTANLVSNGRMAPAGIVAVNRAQERGYSLVSA